MSRTRRLLLLTLLLLNPLSITQASAGTGQTFTFQARTFSPSLSIKLTDARTCQVSLWPCTNYPKPK